MSTVPGLLTGIANRMVPVAATASVTTVGSDSEGRCGEVLSDAIRHVRVEVGPDDELHYGEDMSDEIRGVAFIRGVGAAAVDGADEEAEERGGEFDYGPSGVDAIRGGAFVRGIEVPEEASVANPPEVREDDDGPRSAGDALNLGALDGRSSTPPAQYEEFGCPAPAQSNTQHETTTGGGDERDAGRADHVGGSGSGGAARPLFQPRPPAGPAPKGVRSKRTALVPAEVEAVAVEVGMSSPDDLAGAVAKPLASALAQSPDDFPVVAETLAGAPGRALRRVGAQ